jgi:hypothetical protein
MVKFTGGGVPMNQTEFLFAQQKSTATPGSIFPAKIRGVKVSTL